MKLEQMQVESNLSKTLITGIKATLKLWACAGLGVRTQMLPWSRGVAGARLHSSILGCSRGTSGSAGALPWVPVGIQWVPVRSSGDPVEIQWDPVGLQ